jgi:predicted ATP-grasp superfamily ATP-dependent carboligase
LNKWETFQRAQRAEVPAPKSWLIEREEDLGRMIGEVSYPCVLKPVVASDWRRADKWNIVGARKAIAVSSREELFAEYRTVAAANPVALLQEMVAGGDDCLVTVACYLDRKHEFVAGFSTQKLLQSPPGMGTGCVVRSASHPELIPRTARLLRDIRFSGIAEVEYKWDAALQDFQLIEINPRAWDQHRLGNACGIDLAYLAYCDLAGLPRPSLVEGKTEYKWIAEDAYWMDVLRMLWKRDPRLRAVLKMSSGKKIYGIWSIRDPLPFASFLVTHALPTIAKNLVEALKPKSSGTTKGDLIYDRHLEKGKGQI